MGIVSDPLANAVVIRKVADSLKNSVRASFAWAIDMLNWSDLFKITGDEITYRPTGQVILLEGLDDPLKLKSIRARVGYFKYLWFEEGAEYTSLEEIESVEQSVLRGGEKFIEFITYNPPVEPKHWINEEARRAKAGRRIHESNYRQIPPEWLGPKFLKDAAEMQRDKPDKYAHVYMGQEIGRSEAIIFSGCCRVEEFKAEWRDRDIRANPLVEAGWYINGLPCEGPYFGADWGFSQDPTVLVKCWVQGKHIYVEYEARKVGCELDDTPALFDLIPDARKYKIRADSARPETISHIKNRNFNIIGVEKWKGSVEDGITWIKNYVVIIHPRCTGLEAEAVNYRYKIDKTTREVTADIVDAHNHSWDAVRYAFNPQIQPKPKSFFSTRK